MTVTIKRDGFRQLEENLKSLGSTTQVSFADLFTPEFMQKHTQHKTMEDMFAASGFKAETREDIEAIPDAEWDSFVQRTTKFTSWKDMKVTAAGEFAGRKLSFGMK